MKADKLMANAVVLGALIVGATHATMISTPDYGTASHSTTKWQSLGVESINAPATNNGVFWSTDGGTTFDNTVFDFNAGDEVLFRFEVYKEYWGVHSFDGLTAWMDADQDNTYDPEDLFVKDQWNFNFDDPSQNGVQNYYLDPAPGVPTHRVIAETSRFFYESYTFDEAGEYNLRARVTCSSDLSGIGYNPYPGFALSDWDLAATGHYGQGEVEDYSFFVTSVPEPASVTLLGLGLLGLAFAGRRKRK